MEEDVAMALASSNGCPDSVGSVGCEELEEDKSLWGHGVLASIISETQKESGMISGLGGVLRMLWGAITFFRHRRAFARPAILMVEIWAGVQLLGPWTDFLTGPRRETSEEGGGYDWELVAYRARSDTARVCLSPPF